MSLLESLCTGKLQSQNVVIEDGSEAPGRCLVLLLLHSMCQRYDEVLLMAFERPPHFFLNALPAPLRQKVRVPVLPRPKKLGERLPVGPLMEATRSAVQGTGVTVGVVIDSVSTIVFTHSPTAVPQLVRSLLDYRERGNKVEQVLSLVHTGVHDEAVRRVICGHPDTLIQLRPPSSPRFSYTCLLRHGEAWQRPAFHTEEFNISADCLHLQEVVRKSQVETVQVNPDEPQADPAANLTFNLSLKPEEKAAKDQVVLPYTQMSSPDSGVIHYVPDEDDDFDDEDPDDDLDF
ncbi:elongator complex protein 5-like [Babylonia areolata]|uniref:elongator complex protein 5-like n=1 Tax=Babylonia areolata TaxID=304850 RepID=UPI003FD2F32F